MLSNEQIADDLDAALAILDRDGWTQGACYRRGEGSHCLAGALWEGSFQRTGGSHVWGFPVEKEAKDYIKGLVESLGMTYGPMGISGPRMTHWNDTPGRTFEEVRELLKTKADEIRAGA